MNYILVPLMGIYLVYSLNKRNWIINSYYKFLLQYTVAFIALFGFILMTPQLYLNFKLKSVDHLNWRGLIYRFMTTFIDDLFALMITMPPLRRIMYFRDGNISFTKMLSSLSICINVRYTKLTSLERLFLHMINQTKRKSETISDDK